VTAGGFEIEFKVQSAASTGVNIFTRSCDDDDDDDEEEKRINFSVALSRKTTRTRNNKPKQ